MTRNWFKVAADLALFALVVFALLAWCAYITSTVLGGIVSVLRYVGGWLAMALVLCVAPLAAAGDKPDELSRWGLPDGTVRVDVPGHACGAYDGRARNPRWKLALITKDLVDGPAVRRKAFREDTFYPRWMRATPADYAGSAEFDRGHELAAEFFGLQADRDRSFLLSNMSPQNKRMNEVVLNALEQWAVGQARAGKQVWYFSADVYGSDEPGDVRIQVVGPGRVWVPSAYVKSVLVLDVGQELPAHLHAFLLPNETPPVGASFWQYATSVEKVQPRIGLDLWSELPEPLQTQLEKVE